MHPSGKTGVAVHVFSAFDLHPVACDHLSYFTDPAGLNALGLCCLLVYRPDKLDRPPDGSDGSDESVR
jgi:hypothetical protein